MTLELVKPSLAFLPEYNKAALERGWSPDNMQCRSLEKCR
jgi:hypothetical protein